MKQGGKILKKEDFKKNETAKEALERIIKEQRQLKSNDKKNEVKKVSIQNTVDPNIKKKKEEKLKIWQDANEKIKQDIKNNDNAKNIDYMNDRRKTKDMQKVFHDNMKEYLIDNWAYDGKSDINKFIKKIESEVGSNYHIYQDEEGNVKTFKDENSMERINQVLPFMKPLNSIGNKISKEVFGKDLDFNDIQEKITNVVAKKQNGLSKDELANKTKEIQDANDIINQRRLTAQLLTKGDGLFDFFINKSYNNISKSTIEKYGNYEINELIISRTKFFDYNLVKKITRYDDIYHLALVAKITIDNNVNKYISMQKRQQVMISDIFESVEGETTTQNVKLNNRNITIKELLMNAEKNISKEDYFLYDAVDRNCQDYILNILKSNKIGNQENFDFIKQNVKHLQNSLVQKGLSVLTDLGAVVNQIKGTGHFNDKMTKKQLLLYISKMRKNEILNMLKNKI